MNDFGWSNQGPELESEWMRYHVQGGLEVLAQMLDRYDYTEDTDFARRSLLPLAEATITYYAQHWPRGADGKILLEPSQSIETYQKNAVNPTPDVAGLRSVLPRLLSLPPDLTSETQRASWMKVLQELPAIPIGATARGKLPPKGKGDRDGKRTILPAQEYGAPKNHENPELYTVFPYRLYAVGKPDLELARDTYRRTALPVRQMLGAGRGRISAAGTDGGSQAQRVSRNSPRTETNDSDGFGPRTATGYLTWITEAPG